MGASSSEASVKRSPHSPTPPPAVWDSLRDCWTVLPELGSLAQSQMHTPCETSLLDSGALYLLFTLIFIASLGITYSKLNLGFPDSSEEYLITGSHLPNTS
jgi:hypothetical protein